MLTRRAVLKYGLVAAGSGSLVSIGRWANADQNQHCPANLRLTPFVDALPLPLVHEPVPALSPPVHPEEHQHYFFQAPGLEVLLPRLYEVYMRPGAHQFHRDLPLNLIWGYTQSGGDSTLPLVPGPTYRLTQITPGTAGKPPAQLGTLPEARPVLVRYINALQPDPRPPCLGFGVPVTTVHFHGHHSAARSDGFPVPLEDIASCPTLASLFAPFPAGGAFEPGHFFDYYYHMRLSGFSVDPAGFGEADDMPATRWYHDHLADFTGPNIYKGLAGFALTYDEYEPDDETGTLFPDTNLRLPSGRFDIPLLLQDKAFDARGRLLFNPFDHDGFVGNQFLMNGKVQPYLNVARRKYRFRVLDGSNARVYQMFLSQRANGPTFRFHHIGNEGGLFSEPLRNVTNFRLSPAERAEVVIDFADPQFDGVTTVYFENRLEQDDGRRPNELGKGTLILQFRLGEKVPDPSRIYDILPVEPTERRKHTIPRAELTGARRRTFEFDRRHGSWAINGKLFDTGDQPLARIPLNATERWHLVNKSGGWAHPIHLHLELMHVQRRNGKLPPPEERDGNALKDTVYLGPNDEVEMAMRFRDFTGPYVFHCHNAEHEDAFMMAIFHVFDPHT